MSGPRKAGAFVTFEGADGVGKSTQIARLAERLSRAGRDVVATREPGGSAGAEAIRALLVDGAADRWSPLAEALLVYAARTDHLERVIEPARARGAIVLCDRFSDSTRAYQGIAGALGLDAVNALDRIVVGDRGPDLTIVLDLPEDVARARARERGGAARFELKGAAYQEKVRRAFLEIAAAEPKRCVVIDASASADAVAEKVAAAAARLLGPL